MKWQVDEMTSWWNDKLMKWQVDEMTSWWNDYIMKWQADEMISSWNDKLMKWQADEMISSLNDKLIKRLYNEMTSWRNVKFVKWQVDEMTSWWNNKLINWQVDDEMIAYHISAFSKNTLQLWKFTGNWCFDEFAQPYYMFEKFLRFCDLPVKTFSCDTGRKMSFNIFNPAACIVAPRHSA